MSTSSTRYSEVRNAFQSDERVKQTFAVSDVSAFQLEVNKNGLPTGLARKLTQIGVTSAEQDEIRQSILAQSPDVPGRLGASRFPELLVDPSLSVVQQQAASEFNEFASSMCFTQTSYCVQPRFYTYWQSHGGLSINGYPISPASTEVLEDGNVYTVQYFERAS